MDRVLLPFPARQALAVALAPAARARVGTLAWRRFPDGESLVTVDPGVAGADVAIVASLEQPDAIALALRFAAATARELGARSVGLVAPYLAYLRQDARFHAGEAVNAALFAHFLDESFDWLVTVDPHLHRTASLDALFAMPACNVAAAPAIAAWLRDNVPDALVIGPDGESAQWVTEIAGLAGVPWQVLEKVRRGDADVTVSLPDVAMARGRTPVIVDDIISTGRTQQAALMHLARHGLAPAVCIATHAVFAGPALEQLREAGAARVVTTDTIPHATNAIAIAPLLHGSIGAAFETMENEAGDDAPATAEAWFADNEPPP
jgi:ribose-phosphate pyrophosphokinase